MIQNGIAPSWLLRANLDLPRMAFRKLLPACVMVACFSPTARAVEQAPFRVDSAVGDILDRYCIDCHEAGTEKGDVRLDNLTELSLDARLDLLNRMHEKVYFEEMPPKKKDQPTEEERKQLADWLSAVLNANNASKLADKLRMPDYGNKVDHDKLFSGNFKDLPGYTPDRRWLISEFIFEAKFNKLFEYIGQRDIDGKRQQVIGDNTRGAVNLTNPFLLPTHSGVRYYDTTALDGGHLLTMITNAKEASAYMLYLAQRKSSYVPAITDIMGAEWAHEKILATREAYLKANIEELLRGLYKERHDELLPKFVASKWEAPPVAMGADGKPLKKPVFDTAKPSNEELSEIWSALARNFKEGENGDAIIVKCERDWFHFGINERTIQTRIAFMHGYLDELQKRMPKVPVVQPKPLAESELELYRAALLKHRKAGDTYGAVIAKCLADWSDQFRQEREKTRLTDEMLGKLADQLFVKIIERSPTPQELTEYVALTKSYIPKLGTVKAIEGLIQTLILRTDFVYRQEFGEGAADAHGRKMLSPRDASYALSYALTDSSPDKELQDAVKNGKLNNRDDYRREVQRMLKNRSQYYVIDEAVERVGLNDSFTNIPIRKLRFFREFFGYPGMMFIFKDDKRFGGGYVNAAGRIVSEADMLVEHILNQDQNVFEKLLTTEDFFVYHSGNNSAMVTATSLIREVHDYFKDKGWENFDAEQLKAHIPFLKAHPMPGLNLDAIGKVGGRSDQVKIFKGMMADYSQRLSNATTVTAPFSSVFGVPSAAKTRTGRDMRGPEVAKSFNINMTSWNYPTSQPAKMEHRKGILTHPAWLIAFAANTATDPIRRGKWVREKLLAGTVPDVPVTVDAVIPEDHHNTLRGRLEKVTQAEYCWGCHEKMNPLGLSFEMYDDFGRYRMEEFLEHPDNLVKKMPDKGRPQDDLRDLFKTLPVNSSGKLVGTGDQKLDGDVRDAIDLTERLAKSTKVRQSIIRHAFRYFMGRNEVLSDSKTLIDADQAYVQSGGSFDAVIVSLLTSDSFIYRKPVTN